MLSTYPSGGILCVVVPVGKSMRGGVRPRAAAAAAAAAVARRDLYAAGESGNGAY